MIGYTRELRTYRTREGRRPFREWFEGLGDPRARAKIDMRLHRLQLGNKDTQAADIARAKTYWADYRRREREGE